MNVIPYTDQTSLFEGLVRALPDSCGVLQQLRLVVPSVHFRDWLQIQIARRFGICMGFEFSMPQDFVVEVFRAAGIQRAAEWTTRRLEWSILEKTSSKPDLLPLISSAGSVRDAFALARAVADRFDQYAHFRPEMLEAWEKGDCFLHGVADEQWQRDLWRSLYESFGSGSCLIPSRLEEPGILGTLGSEFPQIIVIGSGSLDPLLVEILRRLAAGGTRVDVHIALPCLGYLGDLRKRVVQSQSAISEFNDPEKMSLPSEPSDNPLLVSMGRHAVGVFVMLGKLDENYSNWNEDSGTHSPATLLQHLQAGVRKNEDYSNSGVAADETLSVHECYGPRRELEVLREELLRVFKDIPDLKPEDVLIAAPSVDDYAPLVPAVFQTKEMPLPVRLAELPAAEGNEVFEGLLAILEIVRGGRGRVSEILDLLQLRAVRTLLKLEDEEKAVEFLSDMLRSCGLTQGFQGDASSAPGGWEFSLNRLAAGVCYGPNEPGASADFFQLPVADLMGSEHQETDRFLDWISDLHSTLGEWQSPAKAADWSARFGRAMETLLGGKDEHAVEVGESLSFLKEIACEQVLDAGVILDWIRSEAEESNRRAPICGAILFGRLRQLHNTPCRVLALVGMQNENFPARTTSPSWDLLRAKPKIWDRNARVDDRQMFLDSLLAPTGRLIITASTRNIRTNKNQPLSTCVEELLSAACSLGAKREALLREHPLQPFSTKYFEPGSNLSVPFGSSTPDIALAANIPSKIERPFHDPSEVAQASLPLQITVHELAAFWKNPARGYLKAQKIDLLLEDEDDTALDFAPITLDSLQHWKLKDAILRNLLAEQPRSEWLQALLAADRGLPPGLLGNFSWSAEFRKMQAIAEEILRMKPEHRTVEVLVSGCRIVCPVQLCVETIVVGECSKMDKPKHWLSIWITALVAGASNPACGVSLFYEGDPMNQKHFPSIDGTQAQAALESLLDGYLQGQSRPLRYAPQTSKVLLGGKNTQRGDLTAAKREWFKTKSARNPVEGEGLSPAASLAWRDCDPFADEQEWLDWADRISQPMETWKSPKKT